MCIRGWKHKRFATYRIVTVYDELLQANTIHRCTCHRQWRYSIWAIPCSFAITVGILACSFLPSLKCLNLAGNLAWLRLRCMHMYNLTGRHKRCPVMSLLQGRKYFFLPCLLQQGLQTSCTKKDAIASFHSTAKNILWINLCKKLITYSNIRFFQKHKNMYGLSDSLFMFHSFCFSYHRTQNVLCT